MTWGAALAVLGTTQQVIGQFYALKSQQTQLKQQAMSLEFQGKMSQINARAAERQAADIIAAGRQQAMEATMRAGQVREAARATMGARGIRADVGSGAETMASIELMKEIDRFTIDANAVRAANAARMQGVNAANEGLLAETSAGSLRMQARALNPVAGAMPSLLTGAGQYLSQRAADRRWAAWASSQGLSE
jgi:DNA gyrase/topoisomerase IV subunit A